MSTHLIMRIPALRHFSAMTKIAMPMPSANVPSRKSGRAS
jgi:hypothetical protein